METFVQLSIDEYQSLKEFENLVRSNTAFWEYTGLDGKSRFNAYNSDDALRRVINAHRGLEKEKADLEDDLHKWQGHVRQLESRLYHLKNRTLLERIFNIDRFNKKL